MSHIIKITRPDGVVKYISNTEDHPWCYKAEDAYLFDSEAEATEWIEEGRNDASFSIAMGHAVEVVPLA
jgi:hypothetical protein